MERGSYRAGPICSQPDPELNQQTPDPRLSNRRWCRTFRGAKMMLPTSHAQPHGTDTCPARRRNRATDRTRLIAPGWVALAPEGSDPRAALRDDVYDLQAAYRRGLRMLVSLDRLADGRIDVRLIPGASMSSTRSIAGPSQLKTSVPRMSSWYR